MRNGYPKFPEKHLQEALFSPDDYVKYRKYPKKSLPKKYVITWQKGALDYFKRKYKPKKRSLYSLINLHIKKDIGFIKMTGIVAPNAVTVMEELIALGCREFVCVGTAGGLHHEGVFLCDKALRDEGTSYHYVKHGKFSFPDKKLTDKLGKSIEKKGMEYFQGTTWTIDTPYRESKAEIEMYAKKGISTVEMEASAVFALAEYRKVSIASAFVVSDVLKTEWEPKFHKLNVRTALNKLVDAAMDCLNS
ncbi:hypothetical protein AUJ84_04040 [Candidatus Pacearchaeota archaeon CG1_02_32_132]|nr:MAG: hypothetical protein AUJ84_04040 [Candidatus Pacearchaeota archaeon CG1_02_32_132]